MYDWKDTLVAAPGGVGGSGDDGVLESIEMHVSTIDVSVHKQLLLTFFLPKLMHWPG